MIVIILFPVQKSHRVLKSVINCTLIATSGYIGIMFSTMAIGFYMINK